MSSGPEDLRGEVARAARVLSARGLVTAYGHVSARAGSAMLITPAADLATVAGAAVIAVATGAMVAEAPEEGDAVLLKARLVGEHLVFGIIARRARPPTWRDRPGVKLCRYHLTIELQDFAIEILEAFAYLLVRFASMTS